MWGVQFTAGQLPRISDRSLIMHRDRCRRLNEQLREMGLPDGEIHIRVPTYRARCIVWADRVLHAAGREPIMKNKLWSIIFLVTLPGLLGTAFAGEPYQWPIITGLKITPLQNGRYSYDVTMGTTMLTGYYGDMDKSVCDILARQTHTSCTSPSSRNVWVGNAMRGWSVPSGGWQIYPIHKTSVNGATFGQAAQLAVAQYSGNFSHSTDGAEMSIGNKPCFGVFLSDMDQSYYPWSLFLTQNGWHPPGTDMCVNIPPQNEWCALQTPTVELAYGTMHIQNATGSTKSTSIEVGCTAGMKYMLALRDLSGTVALSNGMNAELSASGLPLKSTLTGEKGINPVTLQSTLQGTPSRSGAFEGTGVLYVTYP